MYPRFVARLLAIGVLAFGLLVPALGRAQSTEPRVIGRHETHFDPTDTARATNVRLAASLLDGAVIAPRRELSFDRTIGPRTRERGFEDAETLLGGVPTPGIGGGICQVATTLFVAAFTAGLPVPEVRSHSRLPHYAEPGMDAVIAAHQSDLVIGNPFAVPLTIHARADDGLLVIELVAAAEPLVVTWEAHVDETVPIREREQRDRHFPAGTREVVDEGAIGWTVSRTRTVRQGAHVRRDRARVHYHSFRRIIRVGTRRPSPA
jgi:vancomycin resistance protein YoaR